MPDQIATLLTFANLQMAAQATRLDEVRTGSLPLVDALTFGNNRSSKFPEVHARSGGMRWRAVDPEALDAHPSPSGVLPSCLHRCGRNPSWK